MLAPRPRDDHRPRRHARDDPKPLAREFRPERTGLRPDPGARGTPRQALEEVSTRATRWVVNPPGSHVFSPTLLHTHSHTGEGPVYSLLHRLVFGDDRSADPLAAVEEGKTPPASKPKEETTEMSGSEYYGKLAMCVVGLQVSYLTWGVLQVGPSSYQ